MSKIFEIPHRNDNLLGSKMVCVHRPETYEEWQEEIDPTENIPLDPPIEKTTKLLTKTIECKADVIQLDKVQYYSNILYFAKIGDIEILSETRTCQGNSTAEFETYSYTKDFRCYLRHHQIVEFEIEVKDRAKIYKGMRVIFILLETPKNMKFIGMFEEEYNPYEKYQMIRLEFDYKCLDVKYIEV